MSNPSDGQQDISGRGVPDIVLASIAAAANVEPATTDTVTSAAGEATGGVDIEALALKVYALLREEVRVERERSVRS